VNFPLKLIVRVYYSIIHHIHSHICFCDHGRAMQIFHQQRVIDSNLLKIKTTSLGRGAGSEATASRTGGLLMLLI